MTDIVGRRAELAAIANAVSAGQTRAVLLTGEAGSGKTRLLAAAGSMLSGRPVLRLRGHQPESSSPLVAAAGLMRELAVADPRLEKALIQDAPMAMVQIFETVYRALRGTGQSLALLVDDQQWLDPATHALVHYIVRAAHDDALDLFFATATRPSTDSAAVHESLRSVLGDSQVTTLSISGVDQEAGIELVRQFQPEVSDSEATEYWRAAQGSPFWLSMLASGSGEGVASVIRRRLGMCSVDARTVLDMLAVAARPVDVEELAVLLNWTHDRASQALDGLQEHGLIQGNRLLITVVHDLVQDAVVAEIPGRRLADLHGRAADWLSADDEPAILLAAMLHRQAAHRPIGDLLDRVLASPRRAWLGSDGTKQLIALAAGAVEADLPARLGALASLATEIGEPAMALPLWEQAYSTASGAERQAAAIEAARAAHLLADQDTAWKWQACAREMAGSDLSAEIRMDVLESDVLRWLDGSFRDAADASARALSGARTLPDLDQKEARSLLAEALSANADDAMVRGDVVAIGEYAEQLEQISQGDAELQYTAALYRLTSMVLGGDFRGAKQLSQRHWRSALEAGHPARAIEMVATCSTPSCKRQSWTRLWRSPTISGHC